MECIPTAGPQNLEMNPGSVLFFYISSSAFSLQIEKSEMMKFECVCVFFGSQIGNGKKEHTSNLCTLCSWNWNLNQQQRQAPAQFRILHQRWRQAPSQLPILRQWRRLPAFLIWILPLPGMNHHSFRSSTFSKPTGILHLNLLPPVEESASPRFLECELSWSSDKCSPTRVQLWVYIYVGVCPYHS